MATLKYNPIPLMTKFNSNFALYDSLGDKTEKYLATTYDKNYIYFLKNDSGDIIRYDTITEELTGIDLTINEPVSGIILYKGEVYGFAGHNIKQFVNDTVLYIKNNNQLVQESYDKLVKVTHLQSSTQIRDFLIDDEYNYYVIHGFNKISKFTKDRIKLYTKTITPSIDSIFNSLSVMPNDEIQLFKIDYVREYTSEGLKQYPIVLGNITDGTAVLSSYQMFLGKLDSTTGTITAATFIPLRGFYYEYGDSNKVNYNLTNYDYLKNTYPEKNELVFKVILKNVYNNKDEIRVSIPISTEQFVSEYHHFAFTLDGIEGKIKVFCDGKEIKTVDVQKGQYVFQEIFDESVNIGNTYYHNNISLDDYLEQKNYYYINNAKIKQFKFYKKALSNTEIDFHVYNGVKMQDLVVSLPCGQRNELDNIERQFKLDVGGSKSNKINVIIKNSKMTSTIVKDKMKSILEEKLKKVLPVTTTINNIEFR
jgi:hypothetical protein